MGVDRYPLGVYKKVWEDTLGGYLDRWQGEEPSAVDQAGGRVNEYE